MAAKRYDRQIALFGKEGQSKIRTVRVAVSGIGGVGSAVLSQLALLGVGSITLIEPEELDETNRNRHWCARAADRIPGTLKVDIAERMIHEIDPTICVEKVAHSIVSPEGFAAVKAADYVFGCVDREGVRLVLTELCAAYGKAYIDVASDIDPGPPVAYGGRICCAIRGQGCLSCLGELDIEEARQDLETLEQRKDREKIYGVDRTILGRSGPSVVSVNTVIAGLAVTEFIKLCTGLGDPVRLLKYYGETSRVTVSRDVPNPDCWFCRGIWNTGGDADIERYLKK